MKNILAIFLALACIFALFNYDTGKKFSLEEYLNTIAEFSDNRPIMPSTDNVVKIWEDEEYSANDTGIVKVLKTLKNVVITIYECLVFSIKFLVYLVEEIVFVLTLVTKMFMGVLVW